MWCTITAMRLRWEILRVARTAVLSGLGFAFLCLAAFLWTPIAGCVAVGLSLLILEFLTAPETPAVDAGQGGADA